MGAARVQFHREPGARGRRRACAGPTPANIEHPSASGQDSAVPARRGQMVVRHAAGGANTGAPHGSSAFQIYYAKALASWYPRSDLEIDLNLGAANAFGSGTFALAGAAVQFAIVGNVQLLAEVFRDEPGRGRTRSAHATSSSPIVSKPMRVMAIGSTDRPTSGPRSSAFACRRRHSCRDTGAGNQVASPCTTFVCRPSWTLVCMTPVVTN